MGERLFKKISQYSKFEFSLLKTESLILVLVFVRLSSSLQNTGSADITENWEEQFFKR